MRPMTRADAPLFHDLVTRPDVARMLYLFHPGWTLAEAGAFLDDWAWAGRLRFRLALIHQGQWAGWIGTTDDPEPEIFYALRPDCAGQGLAREAVSAFSAFLFDRFNPPARSQGSLPTTPPRPACCNPAASPSTTKRCIPRAEGLRLRRAGSIALPTPIRQSAHEIP